MEAESTSDTSRPASNKKPRNILLNIAEAYKEAKDLLNANQTASELQAKLAHANKEYVDCKEALAKKENLFQLQRAENQQLINHAQKLRENESEIVAKLSDIQQRLEAALETNDTLSRELKRMTDKSRQHEEELQARQEREEYMEETHSDEKNRLDDRIQRLRVQKRNLRAENERLKSSVSDSTAEHKKQMKDLEEQSWRDMMIIARLTRDNQELHEQSRHSDVPSDIAMQADGQLTNSQIVDAYQRDRGTHESLTSLNASLIRDLEKRDGLLAEVRPRFEKMLAQGEALRCQWRKEDLGMSIRSSRHLPRDNNSSSLGSLFRSSPPLPSSEVLPMSAGYHDYDNSMEEDSMDLDVSEDTTMQDDGEQQAPDDRDLRVLDAPTPGWGSSSPPLPSLRTDTESSASTINDKPLSVTSSDFTPTAPPPCLLPNFTLEELRAGRLRHPTVPKVILRELEEQMASCVRMRVNFSICRIPRCLEGIRKLKITRFEYSERLRRDITTQRCEECHKNGRVCALVHPAHGVHSMKVTLQPRLQEDGKIFGENEEGYWR